MTKFEQAVAAALRALYDKQMDAEPTADFTEWVAPRVAAAIVAAYSDYGNGQRAALAALRGDAP